VKRFRGESHLEGARRERDGGGRQPDGRVLHRVGEAPHQKGGSPREQGKVAIRMGVVPDLIGIVPSGMGGSLLSSGDYAIPMAITRISKGKRPSSSGRVPSRSERRLRGFAMPKEVLEGPGRGRRARAKMSNAPVPG
jgi:hypothetical protein